METQRVGIREFRDNLATYLLESDKGEDKDFFGSGIATWTGGTIEPYLKNG